VTTRGLLKSLSGSRLWQMRRFLILGHSAPVHPDFHLNDLPGGAGRLDVLCRAIGATLMLSHGIRRDVETILLLQDSVRIGIAGDRVKRLNPDERSTAALIRRALSMLADEEIQSTPGIYVSRCTTEEAIRRTVEEGASPVVLDEAGQSFESFDCPLDPLFILSDHTDFTEQEIALQEGMPRVSLGPTPLHASQAITITHYLLDRDEQARADQVRSEDLVLAHKVWGEPKALMIKGLLEDFGVPVNLVTHATPSVYPMVIDGLAEVRLMVRSQDVDRVRQIIADYYEPTCET